MQKTTILFLLSVIFSANIFAGNYNNKLTFDTYIFLKQYENVGVWYAVSDAIKSDNYFLQSKNGVEYTKLYIKVNENYSKSAIENIGCKELVKTKSVALLSVPLNQIEQLSAFNFVEMIEIAKQHKPLLDIALPLSNVDKVHQGIDLKRSYFGEGVVIGVVDWGFDFTHPMFLDENENSRVKRVWNTGDNTGNSQPENFNYGTLYTDSSYIKDSLKYSSTAAFGHGTHVLGIATGSKIDAKKNTYSGVAPKSDIAVIDLEGSESGSTVILEALKYLFAYADSVSKPIVVNLSLGMNNDFNSTRDGETILELAINELIDENPNGKIVVAAVGNLGNSNIHFESNFNYYDSANIYSNFTSTSLPNYYGSNISIWGEEPNIIFNIDFYIRQTEQSTNNFFLLSANTNDDKLLDTQIVIDIDGNETSLDIIMQSSNKHTANNKPNLHFFIFTKNSAVLPLLDFTIYSTNTTIHGWKNNGGTFKSNSQVVSINSNYTISSPSAAENVIAVGAYVSRTSNSSTPPEETNIANYSSKGPLANGKIKPDITAPGTIISALHSFISPFSIADETLDGEYHFFSTSGTSVSTPMVTGIVALMLEKKPNLTQSEIKEIIRITAINDEFTGDVRDNKSPIWGWGKINAQAIMKYLEGTSIDENLNMDLYVFPNPTTDFINIIFDNPTSGNVKVDIVDIMGNIISTPLNKYCDAGIQAFSITDLNLSSGAYFVRLNTGKKLQIKSFVLK